MSTQAAMLWLANLVIVIATVAAMEWVAWATHKYIMHGWGWGWHRSHHEPHDETLEKNDLYAIVFAGISILLIAAGKWGVWPLTWVGIGMAVYGLLYFVVHDGLVHQRWPFRHIPRDGYLKRLVQAHRLHHAVEGRDKCISFGFLYAPRIPDLRRELRTLHGGSVQRRPEAEEVSAAPATDQAASG